MTRLEDVVKRQRRRLEMVDMIQQMVKEDPDFLGEIASILANGAPRMRRVRLTDNGDDGGNFAKIKGVFAENANGWLDTAEILKRSGLDKSQFGYITRHSRERDRFEKKAHPQHGRKLLYRLKEAEK